MIENEQLADKSAKLAADVKAKLKGQAENLDAILEEDPIALMNRNPKLSMALSLYLIERTLKGILYIKNCDADSGLAYRREYFYALFGGEDPELIQAEEIERLKRVDEEAAKKEADAKAAKPDPKPHAPVTDEPAVKTGEPAAKTGEPAVKTDEPAAKTDEPAAKPAESFFTPSPEKKDSTIVPKRPKSPKIKKH